MTSIELTNTEHNAVEFWKRNNPDATVLSVERSDDGGLVLNIACVPAAAPGRIDVEVTFRGS